MDIEKHFTSSKKPKDKKQHQAAVTVITMFLKKVWTVLTVEDTHKGATCTHIVQRHGKFRLSNVNQ